MELVKATFTTKNGILFTIPQIKQINITIYYLRKLSGLVVTVINSFKTRSTRDSLEVAIFLMF